MQRLPIPYGYNPQDGSFDVYRDDRHLCCIAPTRSGKGATILIQALLTAGHSMLVIDPKGQNAAVTARARRAMGQDVFVLNPFGLHGGAPWHLPRNRYNPLARFRIDIRNIVSEVAALSRALIVTQGREPYFDDTARDLVTVVILYLIASMPGKATLGHMRKMLTDIAARGKEAAAILIAMAKSPYPFIAQPIGRFMDAEARDISSAVNTAITQTAFLDDPAMTDPERGALSGTDFDLGQLKHKPTSVYLILPGNLMDSYARFLRLLITSALEQITSSPGGYPVLMMLDEFARLENLPALANAFSYAAGFNLQLWPFIQDLSQLESVYDKQAMSILANCGLTQFFTPVDLKTSEYIQRRGGMTTGQSRSQNYGGTFLAVARGETQSETRVPLLPIERTMSMPQMQALSFFAGTHDPKLTGRVPYWEVPRLKGRFDPDPFHMK